MRPPVIFGIIAIICGCCLSCSATVPYMAIGSISSTVFNAAGKPSAERKDTIVKSVGGWFSLIGMDPLVFFANSMCKGSSKDCMFNVLNGFFSLACLSCISGLVAVVMGGSSMRPNYN
mgnify:CR=1 FL=1